MRTHKAMYRFTITRRVSNNPLSRTWKVTCRDQKGGCDSVEQAHCTLSAVKRYRALSEGGGLPNFWLCSLITLKQKVKNNIHSVGCLKTALDVPGTGQIMKALLQ